MKRKYSIAIVSTMLLMVGSVMVFAEDYIHPDAKSFTIALLTPTEISQNIEYTGGALTPGPFAVKPTCGEGDKASYKYTAWHLINTQSHEVGPGTNGNTFYTTYYWNKINPDLLGGGERNTVNPLNEARITVSASNPKLLSWTDAWMSLDETVTFKSPLTIYGCNTANSSFNINIHAYTTYEGTLPPTCDIQSCARSGDGSKITCSWNSDCFANNSQ